jgi:hypothetical protein
MHCDDEDANHGTGHTAEYPGQNGHLHEMVLKNRQVPTALP